MKTLLVLLFLSASVFAQNVNSVAVNPGTSALTLTADQKKGLADAVAVFNAQAQAALPEEQRAAYVPVTAADFLLARVAEVLASYESQRRLKIAAEPTVKEISDKLPTLKATKRAAILAAILAEQEP